MKVKDHDHIIGEYRGSVHQDCNLNFNRSIKITAMFHNLENYDSHLIFQKIEKYNFKINCVPKGIKKYMSLLFDNLNRKVLAEDSH